MIPRTWPSEYVTPNGKTQMIVYALPSVAGLTRWIDYIPVKGLASENTSVENTYSTNGYILMKSLPSNTNLVPFKDYIPVYEDLSATVPWSTDANGYIPAFGVFTVASLFANNEPGVWYDPSDTSTLFQDAAGTTPVTAVEQPVGLMLDKSKGLVLGNNLAPGGGTFDTSAGWNLDAGWSISGGKAIFSATGSDAYLYPSSASGVVADRFYLVTFTIDSYTAGGVQVALGNTTTLGVLRTASGTYAQVFKAGASFNFYIKANATFVGTIDNISVRELPGNHAYQSASSTSRPTLSARYNLLTKTEQFDDAAWTKTRGSVTANAVVAPDGALTGDKLVENTDNNTHFVFFGSNIAITSATTYTFSVYVKAAERSVVRIQGDGGNGYLGSLSIFNLSTLSVSPAAGVTASIVAAGNGWYRCIVSSTSTNITARPAVFLDNGENYYYTGDGTSGIYIWGADLRVTNDALNQPAYQRVNTATDYDTVGFKPYLRFDGSDDWLVTNTITPGTDKVQVFAGVRKLSDAATGVVCEINTSSTNGFGLLAPSTNGSNSYRFFSAGSLAGALAGTGVFAAAPTTNVLTGIGNISGDQVILRVNGTQVAIGTEDQGTGNYGNYPLYIGRRGGTTLPFNGQLYSLIARFGPTLTASQITGAEKYVGTKTGITL